MPVELMLLPRWFPFHLRQGVVLVAHGDRAADGADGAASPARAIRAACMHPGTVRDAAGAGQGLDSRRRTARTGGKFFKASRRACCSRRSPLSRRRCAGAPIARAVRFVTERLNGEDGLGAHLSGDGERRDDVRRAWLSPDHPDAAIAWASVRKLLVVEAGRAYCQPCLSPVWDTGLAGARAGRGGGRGGPAVAARRRLAARQAGAGRGRRLGAARPDGRAGRLGVPVRQRPLPGRGRHRRRRHAAAPPDGDPAYAEAIARGARLDRRHAEPRRRLGRVRRRQRPRRS